MKALWKSGNGLLQIREIEEPILQFSDDVKIKITYAMIGNEDLRMYREGDYYSKSGVAGYEMSGVIVELGSHAAAQGYYIGQRVSGTLVCFCGKCYSCKHKKEMWCSDFKIKAGTICEYIVWSSKQLVPLGERISDKLGALLEPVAVVAESCRRMQIQVGDSICIFGADFQGLVMLQIARLYGAHKITVVDSVKSRCTLARTLGADYVIDSEEDAFENQLLDITDFNGFDAVAISTGDIGTFRIATDLVARGGVLLLTTYYGMGQKLAIDSAKFCYTGIYVTSSLLYGFDTLELTGRLLPTLNLNALVGMEFPFDQSVLAYEALKTGLHPRIAIKL